MGEQFRNKRKQICYLCRSDQRMLEKSNHQSMAEDQNNENTKRGYIRRKEGSTGVKQELQDAKLDEVGFIQKFKNRAILSGRFWWVFTRTLGQGSKIANFYADDVPGPRNMPTNS